MNTLPKFSPKRKAEIGEGKRLPNGKLKMTAEQFRVNKSVQKALHKSPKSTRSKAMKEADKWFSEWIRLRDSDSNGRVKCVTCSHTAHWRQMQCGHFVTRGHQATRYDEKNASGQCRGCNYNGGQILKHAAALNVRYGYRVHEELQERGAQECVRKTRDFQYIADHYKRLVFVIRQEQPGRYFAK